MSSTGISRWASILLVSAVLLAGCSSPTTVPPAEGNAAQACAEPRVVASPLAAHVGDPITLEGTDWVACNDTPNGPTPEPWTEVSFEWVQQGVNAVIESVIPVDGSFARDITVPDKAIPGEATVRVKALGFDTEVTVTVMDETS